jgi:hypothetical protein
LDQRTEVIAVHFAESPPHSSLDPHARANGSFSPKHECLVGQGRHSRAAVQGYALRLFDR